MFGKNSFQSPVLDCSWILLTQLVLVVRQGGTLFVNTTGHLTVGVNLKRIICEYTVYGNSCPDLDCILDHTPLPSVEEPKILIQSTLTYRPDGHSWSFLTQR